MHGDVTQTVPEGTGSTSSSILVKQRVGSKYKFCASNRYSACSYNALPAALFKSLVSAR